MPHRVYLDWNATTPLRHEAREAMAEAWDLQGNPSSVHAEGRHARRVVEEARGAIAAAVGALPRNVIFTSGGTEGNALALSPGLRRGSGYQVQRLMVSAIEHASVLSGGQFRADCISKLEVTPAGVLDLGRLAANLDNEPPALVSLMLANNETGAVQPVAQAAEAIHAAGGLLHVDAVQGLGKIPSDIKALGADLMTISAHKLGGPKGIGALILGERLQGLPPMLRGGGQERGQRAGTENVAGIAGFGAAVKAALGELPNETVRQDRLRGQLESGLRRHTPDLIVFSEGVPRLSNSTLFTVPGLRAETAVIGFDLEGIAVSSGSACSSGKVQPSHVLEAMGFGREMANGAVRVSLGWSTTAEDIDCCLEAWRKLAGTLLRGERRNTA
jgi:cysteine desulfurase